MPVKALPRDTEMKEQKQDQTQEIEPEASKQGPDQIREIKPETPQPVLRRSKRSSRKPEKLNL